MSKRILLGLWFLALSVIASDAAQPLYVPVQHGDCINTFTVRLMVAASNYGTAWGEFEGSRILIERRGLSVKTCWLEFRQWGQNGRLEDNKRLQCLFVNPLGEGY